MAITFSAFSPSTVIAAILNASPIVEQAPYRPKKGISKSSMPNVVAISCPNKSPAKMYLMSSLLKLDLKRSFCITSFCKRLSASSHVS